MAGAAAAIAAHRVYVRKFGREDELGEHIAGNPETSSCAELGEWLLDIRSSSYHAAFPHEPSDRNGFVVDEPQFNVVIGDIIFCNAVVIGYETDWCLKEPTACEASWTLYIIENVFTIIWVVEFILRVRAHHFSGYFKDKANWLDFGLAALSVLDVWVLQLYSFLMNQGGAQAPKFLSILRLLRLLRLVRLIRLVKIFKELWLVVKGMYESFKVLFWVILLLLMVIYPFAIFLHIRLEYDCDAMASPDLCGPGEMEGQSGTSKGGVPCPDPFLLCYEMFGTVPRSMYTMFQVMTLESWSMEVVRKIMRRHSLLVPHFILYLFITTFGLMNIVVGVIVENTLQIQKENEGLSKRRREALEKRTCEELRLLFLEADAAGNANGKMDIDEFQGMLEIKAAKQKFEILQVPIDNPRELFNLFEQDDDGEITMDDFFAGILKIKGEASGRDMMTLVMAARTVANKTTKLENHLDLMWKDLSRIPKTTKKMTAAIADGSL
jgi:voltage-gated sodium channel